VCRRLLPSLDVKAAKKSRTKLATQLGYDVCSAALHTTSIEKNVSWPSPQQRDHNAKSCRTKCLQELLQLLTLSRRSSAVRELLQACGPRKSRRNEQPHNQPHDLQDTLQRSKDCPLRSRRSRHQQQKNVTRSAANGRTYCESHVYQAKCNVALPQKNSAT
jgi:hypothetical protein